jgi:hypothetical protein
MKLKVACLCLAAVAYVGCATAELVTPPPLSPCDATGDCPIPDAGKDAPADVTVEAAPGDSGGPDTGGGGTDAADAGHDASDGAADADAKG